MNEEKENIIILHDKECICVDGFLFLGNLQLKGK